MTHLGETELQLYLEASKHICSPAGGANVTSVLCSTVYNGATHLLLQRRGDICFLIAKLSIPVKTELDPN